VVRGRGSGATAVQQSAFPATPTARTAPSDSPIVLVAAGIIVVIVIGCRQGTATTAQQTAPLPLQTGMLLHLVVLVVLVTLVVLLLLACHRGGSGTLQQARCLGGQVETIHIHTLESIPAEQLVHGVVREFLEGEDKQRRMSYGEVDSHQTFPKISSVAFWVMQF